VQVSGILHSIDQGAIALPEFQRGYVWNRDQVRKLVHSLYRRHPVGSLLVWVTKTEMADARGDGPLSLGNVKLLLDGQQRITSLYGIIKGSPPAFFQGDAQTFTGLRFHLENEVFEFHQPIKMRDDPLWIDVTQLMERGVGDFIVRLLELPDFAEQSAKYITRLNGVEGIKNIDLHMDEVTGEDKTVDEVVEIFNNVNSGGTKLSKGDLALAKICAQWPDARSEMQKRLTKWSSAGFSFRLEWLLRCVNAIVTGEALFSALKDVDTSQVSKGLRNAERAVDMLLNMIASRLGLDHDLVLGSRYSFPLLSRYLVERDWQLHDQREWDKILYWYVHTFLWGRYAGSTESVLNQDLASIEDLDGALDRLIAQMGQTYRLRLNPDDFSGWSKGARFFPLLYMLTRVNHSLDLGSGVELSGHLLGKGSALQVHHVFPKALLYRHDYSRADVNAIANFTFLTAETNLKLSDRAPAEYLQEVAERFPDALRSHWIPTDPELWQVENYREFLAARRVLLAEAANSFLDGLLHGLAPPVEVSEPVVGAGAKPVPGRITSESEEGMLLACRDWIQSMGLPAGEYQYELIDPSTNEPVAILDLAWPDGLQEGLSQPVALLIDEDETVADLANQAGFLFYSDILSFRRYVQRDVLALEEDIA
jgi:hypothetical protein